MTTIQDNKPLTSLSDRIIKDFKERFTAIVSYEKWSDEDEATKLSEPQYLWNDLTKHNPKTVEQFLIKSIKEVEEETRKETLDLIAEDQGWEESRDIYANALGLPLKYPKLMESYKKRNHIKGKIILDCQNLSITNKEKQ